MQGHYTVCNDGCAGVWSHLLSVPPHEAIYIIYKISKDQNCCSRKRTKRSRGPESMSREYLGAVLSCKWGCSSCRQLWKNLQPTLPTLLYDIYWRVLRNSSRGSPHGSQFAYVRFRVPNSEVLGLHSIFGAPAKAKGERRSIEYSAAAILKYRRYYIILINLHLHTLFR